MVHVPIEISLKEWKGDANQPSVWLQVPNGFGCGLGAVQLILYFIYRDSKGNEAEGISDGNVDAELGPAHKPQQKQ